MSLSCADTSKGAEVKAARQVMEMERSKKLLQTEQPGLTMGSMVPHLKERCIGWIHMHTCISLNEPYLVQSCRYAKIARYCLCDIISGMHTIVYDGLCMCASISILGWRVLLGS